MDVPKREEQILEKWREIDAFKKSVALRSKNKKFVFYEGPPTANGVPGLHHILTRSFKDAVCRYKTMVGYKVERKAGWDTHGLPVEIQVEKQLGIKHKGEIEKYGVVKFNKKCKESVWQYKTQWEELTERMGFWIDADNPYITYDPLYIESLWHILKTAHQNDLLYQGHHIVPFCTRCGTSLSSHEVAQGYEDITDRSVFVKFPLANAEKIGLPRLTNMLVWTTTPWTLPANTALAVGADINYVLVKQEDEHFIVARDRVDSVMQGKYKIEKAVDGAALVGSRYLPPFDTLSAHSNQAFVICEGSFVHTDEGTGVVHIAPMYGEDDYQLADKNNLPKVHTVDEQGAFYEFVGEFGGKQAYESSPAIISALNAKNLLYKEENYRHTYPFCWRCSTPLLYYAQHSWFVKMSALRDKLIKANNQVRWVPEYIQHGRFGEWLDGVKDWAIARSRYWGTPLPIWKCNNEECQHIEVIGSRNDIIKSTTLNNEYFLMRHGYSEKNKQGVFAGSYPEKIEYNLLPKGAKQAEASAKKLKKENIDIILTSPIKRAQQTADIIGKITGVKPQVDKQLLETDHGVLEEAGTSSRREMFPDMSLLFETCPKNGETMTAVRKRMTNAIKDCEKKYKGKKIVLVSHGDPIWLLGTGLSGCTIKESVEQRGITSDSYLQTGSYKKMENIALFPYNEQGELDFHRPYVDNISFACKKCEAGTLKRDPNLADVWFDSGAMPYASVRYPFQNKQKVENGELFPADFIVEAIDQTRGWFYTLFAVSAMLGFIDKTPPYKNVISLGHVLDERGKKMSKSKGNVVDPFDLAEVHGMDAVRWYFFTVNSPGDVKRFRERDITQTRQKFIATLDNSLTFLRTYAPDITPAKSVKGATKMEEWILARLKQVYITAFNALEEYDMLTAARAIDDFVLNDISNWYIRRSRSVFQRSESKKELAQSAKVLAFVLNETAKLIAPFTPFVAEYMWQNLNNESAQSVHWQEWTTHKKDLTTKEKKILQQMQQVRNYATVGLRLRSEARIRVRQPLYALCVPQVPDKQMVSILSEEVNVQTIVADKKEQQGQWAKDKVTHIELNILIDEELEKQGAIRDIIRRIQDARKELNLQPSDTLETIHYAPESSLHLTDNDKEYIAQQVRAKELVEGKVNNPHKQYVEIKTDALNLVVYKP